MNKSIPCRRCNGTGEVIGAAWLRATRKASGLSLAKVAKVAGCTPQFLSELEKIDPPKHIPGYIGAIYEALPPKGATP